MWSHNYTCFETGNISQDVEFGWVPVFFLFLFFFNLPRQEVNVNITVLTLFVVGMWREQSTYSNCAIFDGNGASQLYILLIF